MKRFAAMLLLGVAATACTSANAVHIIPPNQLPAALYGKQPSNSRTQQVSVFFVRGNRLVAQPRQASSSPSLPVQAMRQLLKGPSPEEQADGVSTAIPQDTALLSVTVDSNRVATVNLSQEFSQVTDRKTQSLRLAQVVFTLTDLPQVDSVRFRVEGDNQPEPDERGALNNVLGPGKYSNLAPQEGPTHVDPCTLVDSLGSCQSTSTSS
jgi:capsular polysaccharide biosynthesis protein